MSVGVSEMKQSSSTFTHSLISPLLPPQFLRTNIAIYGDL